MNQPKTKQQALDRVLGLETEIEYLAKANSLATLEHKLKVRQEALEALFSNFMKEINQDDMQVLKDIQVKNQILLEKMQANKQEKGEEIIKYKNTGKRVRLYSDIAQHK